MPGKPSVRVLSRWCTPSPPDSKRDGCRHKYLALVVVVGAVTILLVGCPNSPGGMHTVADIGTLDATEFQYSLSATGTLTGHTGGTPFIAMPSSASCGPDGERLEINVFFDTVHAGVQLHLDYNRDNGNWRSSAQDGSERFWFTYYPSSDRLIRQRSGSSAVTNDPGYSLRVTTEADRPWVITSLSLDFERGLTMAPASESVAFEPITFDGGSLRVEFAERGYILTDHFSAYSPRELRFYDTSAALLALDPAVEAAALDDPERHLASLAEALTADTDDPGLKLRLIHDWVVSSIYYDMYALAGKRVAAEGPFEVIRRGAAVCEGLSRLIDYMCATVGVYPRMVTGRTPGQGTGFGHAWNVVSVNGEVLFFDPTFANRNFWNYDGTPVVTEGGMRSNYFLVEPEAWIASHAPTKELYQFLDTPVSPAEFEAGSLHRTLVSAYYDNLHHLGITLPGGPPADRISVGDEPAMLVFDHPDGTEISGFLRSVADLDADLSENLECQAFIRTGQSTTIFLHPAEPGDYWYYLKARGSGTSEAEPVYVAILYLTSTGAPTAHPFPEQFQQRYRDQRVVLESPLAGDLKRGTSYTFRFTASDLASATLYPYTADGPDFSGARSFSNTGDTWQLNYTVPTATDYLYYHVSTNEGSGSSPVLRYYLE